MIQRFFISLTICLIVFHTESYAQEVGIASFYHHYFNGKKTANGEIFDNNKMTCAHKNLPFGTMLKVTNSQNDQSVIVRVNDRGPYVKGRVLDLSFAAAKILGFVNKGTTTVIYEEYKEIKEVPKLDTLYKLDTLSIPKASTF
jgi:rare lipoprotein A